MYGVQVEGLGQFDLMSGHALLERSVCVCIGNGDCF